MGNGERFLQTAKDVIDLEAVEAIQQRGTMMYFRMKGKDAPVVVDLPTHPYAEAEAKRLVDAFKAYHGDTSTAPGKGAEPAKKSAAAASTASPAVSRSKPSATDAKLTAEWEWDANDGGCRSQFATKEAYVGYRAAQLDGRTRDGSPAAAEVEKRVEKLVAAGSSRPLAFQKVFAADPALQDRYIEEKNKK